jgi:hypothetical protein
MDVLRPFAAAAILSAAGPAAAHVTADPGEARAGSYQAVQFRVGHSCNDTVATTALRIELPPGLPAVRAQPKPGWTLTIDRDPAAPGRITAVTWRGRLPPDQFDEFGLFFRLPPTAGVLHFPTVQSCGALEKRWTQVAAPEAPRPEQPAPALRLTGPMAPPQSGHSHH